MIQLHTHISPPTTHTNLVCYSVWSRVPCARYREEQNLAPCWICLFNLYLLLFTKRIPVQLSSLSRVQLFATPWTAARQASLSITNSQSLLKLTSTESVMPSNHLILCHTLLLSPSIFPRIRVFLNESALHIRWPKYWNFSFNISPSNEHSGLISFRMDGLDLLNIHNVLPQGTLPICLKFKPKCLYSGKHLDSVYL